MKEFDFKTLVIFVAGLAGFFYLSLKLFQFLKRVSRPRNSNHDLGSQDISKPSGSPDEEFANKFEGLTQNLCGACGRKQRDVKKLVATPDLSICDNCIRGLNDQEILPTAVEPALKAGGACILCQSNEIERQYFGQLKHSAFAGGFLI